MDEAHAVLTEQEAHRFWAMITPDENGCWVWKKSSRTRGGYGTLKLRGVSRRSHKIAYVWAHGEVPDGLELDHLCRNRSCCNPEHLEAVTHLENIRRGRTGRPRAEATHCPSGHPYSGDNLTIDCRGRRKCLTCWKKTSAGRGRRYYWANPEKARAQARASRQRKLALRA